MHPNSSHVGRIVEPDQTIYHHQPFYQNVSSESQPVAQTSYSYSYAPPPSYAPSFSSSSYALQPQPQPQSQSQSQRSALLPLPPRLSPLLPVVPSAVPGPPHTPSTAPTFSLPRSAHAQTPFSFSRHAASAASAAPMPLPFSTSPAPRVIPNSNVNSIKTPFVQLGSTVRHALENPVGVVKYRFISHVGTGQCGQCYEAEVDLSSFSTSSSSLSTLFSQHGMMRLEDKQRVAIKVCELGPLRDKLEKKKKLEAKATSRDEHHKSETESPDKDKEPSHLTSTLDVTNEIKIQSVLKKFTGVVKIYDFFNDDTYCYLVMELCHGSTLTRLIADYKTQGYLGIPHEQFIDYAWQLVLILYFMKKQRIIHRDIKPDNVMFKDEKRNILKLSDFGLSEIIQVYEKPQTGRMAYKKLRTVTGTPYYMAPDILRRSYAFKVDVYALGMVFYQMCYGKVPFPTSDFKGVIALLLDPAFHIEYNDQIVHPDINDLLKNMLQRDEKERFNIKQVLLHPLFQKSRQNQRDRRAVFEQKIREASARFYSNQPHNIAPPMDFPEEINEEEDKIKK